MENILPFVFFAVGLVLIIKGSDWFVDSAVWVAKTFGVPDIIIGATLVSVCTTLPESLVSITAVLKTPPNTELSIANALGSIACNTGLILPICVIFSQPEWLNRESFQRNGKLLVGMFAAVFAVALFMKEIPRFVGVILLLGLLWFLLDNVNQSRLHNKSLNEAGNGHKFVAPTSKAVLKNTLLLAAGITMTIIGANLLVVNTELIARFFGVPDAIIGITLTAFGTSLPEFMTCITSMVKKVHNISLGNIIGADLLNVLLVIGGSATVRNLPVGGNWLTIQFPLTFAILIVTVGFSFVYTKNFKRYAGFLILALYSVLITLSIMS